jgi:hypothetical protein
VLVDVVVVVVLVVVVDVFEVVVVVVVVDVLVVVLLVVVSVIVVVVVSGVCALRLLMLPAVPPSIVLSPHSAPAGFFLSRLRPFPFPPMLGVYVSWSTTFPPASFSVIVSPSFDSP